MLYYSRAGSIGIDPWQRRPCCATVCGIAGCGNAVRVSGNLMRLRTAGNDCPM